MKHRSIRLDINLAILATCTLIALIFYTILSPYTQTRRQMALDRIETLCSAVFQQRKEAIANEIFAGQHLALASSINEIRRVKGIDAVTVFELQGRLLQSNGDPPSPNLDAAQRERLKNAHSFARIQVGGRPFAEFVSAIDVIGERVGYLALRFDLAEEERDAFQAMLFFISLLVAILLVTSLVLNVMLHRVVVRPARLLRDALLGVQENRLGETVALAADDEIGQIAVAFNQMSLRLRQQHDALTQAIETKDSYAGRLEETNMALERLNAQLEEMVDERTVELRRSNAQLQQEIDERLRVDRDKQLLEERLTRSQKMEALGLLAGGVAHDLNNVLSGMVSYPDLLLMDLPASDPMRRPIKTIRESGRKAAAIVQDLLTLARRGVVNTEILNLNEIIDEYLASPEYEKLQSYHSGVALNTNLDAVLMNIKGSSVHLRKTVMNLVSNAAEAQPGGGTIDIATCNRYVDRPIEGYDSVHEGDYVVLMVADRGTGIAAEDLKRIFEPFYTKKVMGRSGTGLGMALVWGTVQDHHGYINVTSTQGAGTRFELFFPASRDPLPGQPAQIPFDSFQGHGERLLVVDDVPEQREIAAQILRKLGYDVSVVASGEAALEFLRHQPVALIVLDMIMDPGMDGLDTYREILRIFPGQRAIIASGYAENERVKEAQRLGAGQYLRKPYTLERIGLAVRDELARRTVRQGECAVMPPQGDPS